MVADLSVRLDTGGTDGTPGTATDTDVVAGNPPNIRFKTNDNPTIDAIDPVPIPAAGTVHSYWKQIYLFCDVAPDTQVDNIKFYTDTTDFGTGITTNVGDQFPAHTSVTTAGYILATGTPGASGDEIIANHTGISSVTDAFSFSVGSPLSGPTIGEDTNIINATGETTNYIVFQVAVINTATPGNKSDETWTFQYDEV